jgi:hypothetical protein
MPLLLKLFRQIPRAMLVRSNGAILRHSIRSSQESGNPAFRRLRRDAVRILWGNQHVGSFKFEGPGAETGNKELLHHEIH